MSNGQSQASETRALLWRELPERTRDALWHKLMGLYGGGSDQMVFDALAIDKQQALLILLRKLQSLKLWDAVRRIENVYGEGGVGINFTAWPYLKSAVEWRGNFTTRFATHKNTTRGYMERRTGGRPSLHVLYVDQGETRKWEAHFDLYNPWASPLNTWRHLLHEKMRRETPNWRAVGASLGYLGKSSSTG